MSTYLTRDGVKETHAQAFDRRVAAVKAASYEGAGADTIAHALERAAAADLRSVNAEIECLLREALQRRGVKVAPPEQRKRGRPAKED